MSNAVDEKLLLFLTECNSLDEINVSFNSVSLFFHKLILSKLRK